MASVEGWIIIYNLGAADMYNLILQSIFWKAGYLNSQKWCGKFNQLNQLKPTNTTNYIEETF